MFYYFYYENKNARTQTSLITFLHLLINRAKSGISVLWLLFRGLHPSSLLQLVISSHGMRSCVQETLLTDLLRWPSTGFRACF